MIRGNDDKKQPMFSAVKRTFGGGGKGEKTEENVSEQYHKESSSSHKEVEAGAGSVQEATGYTKEEDNKFDAARAKTMEAEHAARLAHANAEKALRLLKASEESSREVEEYRKQVEHKAEQLDDLKGADIEAQGTTDAYAKAREAAKEKAALFDKARDAARQLKQELEDTSNRLKKQEDEVVRLAGEQDQVRKSVDTFSVTVQNLNTSQPDKGNEAKKARGLADDKAGLLAKLKGEAEAEEKRAADLEKKAQEARRNAKAKSDEYAKLEKEAQDLKGKADNAEKAFQDLQNHVKVKTTKLTEAKGDVDKIGKQKAEAEAKLSKLSDDLEGISNRVNAKIEEAKAKRSEYDRQKADLEEKAKAAKDASASLKETQQTRSLLEKEKEEVGARVEKLEDKLSVETEAAQKALEESKRAEGVKHAKWLEAEKLGQEADKYAADKNHKVEEVLQQKITSLAQQAVQGNKSETKTEGFSNKETTREVAQTKDGKESKSVDTDKKFAQEKSQNKDGHFSHSKDGSEKHEHKAK